MYGSTLSLTSALDGDGWSTARTGRFTPGQETRYPLYKTPDGPQGRSGQVQKILLPPELDPRAVQPVAGRYTDYAIPAQPTIWCQISTSTPFTSNNRITLPYFDILLRFH